MTPFQRASRIMQEGGFTVSPESGPYVTELFYSTLRQVRDEGLLQRSAGTWFGDPDDETRARDLLAIEWAVRHNHAYRVENIDGYIFEQWWQVRSGRHGYRIRWDLILPTIRDRLRKWRASYRAWRDGPNPYL